METAITVLLALLVLVMAGMLVVLILLGGKLKQLIKIYKNHRGEGAEQTKDLKLFDQLPTDYKDAVNHIVANVLGDESPEMNNVFRIWQAEIFEAGVLEEDKKPDLKLLEIEALAFRDGFAAAKRFDEYLKEAVPEFREYARLKYPELSEDMITTISDLIGRGTGGSRV